MDILAAVYAKLNMIIENYCVDRTFQLIKDKFIAPQLKERSDTTHLYVTLC